MYYSIYYKNADGANVTVLNEADSEDEARANFAKKSPGLEIILIWERPDFVPVPSDGAAPVDGFDVAKSRMICETAGEHLFSVHAREALPAALDEIERLREALKGAKVVADQAKAIIAARDNPQPLTLDEFRERDGKPVWMVYNSDGDGMWRVFRGIDTAFSEAFVKFDDGSSIEVSQYNKTWIAYDYPPPEVPHGQT
jgi:hypothetical protein